MAKKTVAVEIEEMVKAGNAVVVEDGKFADENGNPTRIRSMESMNDPLEIGDSFKVPTDYTVLKVKIGERTVPCTIVEVTEKDGTERNMQFFPNSLAKNITPLDAEGKRMPKVKTTGAVASWYADLGSKGMSVDEAMAQLAGKTIVVTAKETYTIRDYNTKTNRQTSILGYDWKA